MKVYSIYDKKSEHFGVPFFCVNEGVAKREFDRLQHDEDSYVCAYPDDYSLYGLGDFDDVKGKISPFDLPELIVL